MTLEIAIPHRHMYWHEVAYVINPRTRKWAGTQIKSLT